jgi:hypothetical protein
MEGYGMDCDTGDCDVDEKNLDAVRNDAHSAISKLGVCRTVSYTCMLAENTLLCMVLWTWTNIIRTQFCFARFNTVMIA